MQFFFSFSNNVLRSTILSSGPELLLYLVAVWLLSPLFWNSFHLLFFSWLCHFQRYRINTLVTLPSIFGLSNISSELGNTFLAGITTNVMRVLRRHMMPIYAITGELTCSLGEGGVCQLSPIMLIFPPS